MKKLAGADWASAKIEFDRWRMSSAIFPAEVWRAADKYHGYQWWSSFGDDFEHLQKIAQRVLAQPVSASTCEFNWRDVGNVITKKTQRLRDDKLERMVNTRAMVKLNDTINRKVLLGNIPKLDDILEEFIQEAINNTENGEDDVADPDELSDGDQDDDDEAFDVVHEAEAEDELGALGARVNADLELALGAQMT